MAKQQAKLDNIPIKLINPNNIPHNDKDILYCKLLVNGCHVKNMPHSPYRGLDSVRKKLVNYKNVKRVELEVVKVVGRINVT